MSDSQLQLIPFARIHGEPMLALPQDLYIPPDALELVLDTFQGPLDLLLYLIRRHNLDVLDIPMAELTRQYMGYIVLMEIKSRMLLPKISKIADDSGEDPRAELMRRLLEYEQMKLAAQQLNALPQAQRDFEIVQVFVETTVQQRLPEMSVEDLKQVWLGLLTRAKNSKHHTIRREQLSVREQMTHVLRSLKSGEYVLFESLFELDDGLPKMVVTFIAILELAKEFLVEIQQTETFGSIYVRTNRAINDE